MSKTQRLQWNIDTSKSDSVSKGASIGTGVRTATWKFNNTLRTNWNTAITKFGPGTDEYNGLQDDEQKWFDSLLTVLQNGDGKTRLLQPMGKQPNSTWKGKTLKGFLALITVGTSELYNEPNEYVGIQYGCLLETILKACEEHQQGIKPFADNNRLLGTYTEPGADVLNLGGKIRYEVGLVGNQKQTKKTTVPRTLDKKNKLFFKYKKLSTNIPESLT